MALELQTCSGCKWHVVPEPCHGGEPNHWCDREPSPIVVRHHIKNEVPPACREKDWMIESPVAPTPY